MNRCDYAWAAGLFDGEGCVTTLWPSRKQARMEINMCHKPTLERFAKIIGCGKVTKSYEKRKAHRTQWRWRVCDNQSVSAAKKLEPYSSEKRQQLKALIRFRELDCDMHKEYYADLIKTQKRINYD